MRSKRKPLYRIVILVPITYIMTYQVFIGVRGLLSTPVEQVSFAAATALAIVALVALVFTRRQVEAAEKNTRLQRQISEDAAQPYVWVDIRLHDQHGGFLMLVLKNEGPTVATDVTIKFDPALPSSWRDGRSVGPDTSQDDQRAHFQSLPPGRLMQWNLGVHHEILDSSAAPTSFSITVEATGPYGPISPLLYTIDLNEYLGAAMTVSGTPLSIVKAMKDSTTVLQNELQSIAKRLPFHE